MPTVKVRMVEERNMNDNKFVAAMSRALALAGNSPIYGENPQVGAILINDAGEIIAEGWHKGAGTPHAEIDALNNLSVKGLTAKGLTAVVTLEPCNHIGKTGPCAQALIEAGVKKVVFGTFDPGKTEGGGRFTLEDAGVEVVSDILRDECVQLIAPWFTNKFKNRPYVVIKWAASIDGRTAAADGTSKWITGAEAREDVHARRAHSQAILVGTNTVELDDPELTARKPDASLYENQPLRVIVGERELSPTVRVFSADAQTVHYKTRDLTKVMQQLFERGIRQVFVEGGAQLESSLIGAGIADEYLIYVAPKLIGGPATAIRDIQVASINQAIDLEFIETKKLGADILIRAINKEN
jgi:diaminohydroxyphosphoribosylaminopyrimidine deaminase/5-amino-6-(5-phosphoribosylamino)uracil reductase